MLDDVIAKSALLDIQGDLERAAQRARTIDLRRVKDAQLRKLIVEVREQSAALTNRLKQAS